MPPLPDAIPRDIERALKSSTAAWNHFERLAPSYRRAYIAWLVTAKRKETKERRLREATALLSAGKKLGLR